MQTSERIGTWDTLRMWPATLSKWVAEGKASIVGTDRYGSTIYELHRPATTTVRKKTKRNALNT